MNHGALKVLFLVFLVCCSSAAHAGEAQGHRRSVRRSSPGPSLQLPVTALGRPSRPQLLDGRLLTLRDGGPARPSALAITARVIRVVRRGVFAGTVRTDGNDKASRGGLSWTAGAVPFSALPTASSLSGYNCHVADRLPGDPAPIYRFTVVSLRF